MTENREHAGMMASYKNISAKLKKRFLRKPNQGDAIDQYESLSKWLEGEGIHQYAAFCMLAAARCDQAMGNPTGEADKFVKSGQLFSQAEIESKHLDFCGFEDNLVEAVECYEIAIDVYCKIQRTAFAATLRNEMANSLVAFGKLGDACKNYRAAATLLEGSPLPRISALSNAADCLIREEDYAGALEVCVDIITTVSYHAKQLGDERWDVKSPGDHFFHYGNVFRSSVYGDVVEKWEIVAVFLLLLLPAKSREEHIFSKTLPRYRNMVGECTATYMREDVFFTVQSVVLSVESNDLVSLRQLQSELWHLITPLQNELLHKLLEFQI
eukprot:m.22566 g.22566  ORF g.22566 m.22566 type:complete len:327 (+) comp13858_c0_seq1:315-1295(+)